MVININVTDVSSRQSVYVEISEESTVRQLKCLIEGKGLGPVYRQRLAHAGQILNDDKSLQDCGLVSIPSVVLSLRPIPADPTVGAMSQAPNRPPDNPHPNVEQVQFTYTPTANMAANATEEDDNEEDLNIPTCRICHGH